MTVKALKKKNNMAFKMKAGKEGPMKKNFPSAFKKEEAQATRVLTTKELKDRKINPKPGMEYLINEAGKISTRTTVKEQGNIPTMLQNKTNINKVKINGKKALALEPAVSFIIFATNV